MRQPLWVQRIRSTPKGFTATELLVAGLITSVVIVVSGTGILTMITANARSEARSERRMEMNRALDFVSDDVKTSSQMWDRTTPPGWASALSLGTANAEQPGLYLQVPLTSVTSMAGNTLNLNNHGFEVGDAVVFTGTATVTGISLSPPTPGIAVYRVYYVVNRAANSFEIANTPGGTPLTPTFTGGTLIPNRLVVYYTRNNHVLWLGPRTLNRATGNCAPSPDAQCPVLVDSVSTDTATPAFVATVMGNRQVSLGLTAHLFDNSMFGASSDTLTITTDSAARPGLMAFGGGIVSPTAPPVPPPPTLLPGSPSGGLGGGPSGGSPLGSGPSGGGSTSSPSPLPSSTCPDGFDLKDGTVTLKCRSSNISLRIIGGDLRCGSGASPMQTRVSARVQVAGQSDTVQGIATPMAGEPTAVINFGSQEVGARLDVTGSISSGANNNFCGLSATYNSANPADNGVGGGTPQVIALRHGDSLPNLAPFGASPRIDQYLIREGYINAQTLKVTIAPNQVIYLFELGATNPNANAYDLQDVVALATITSL